MKVRFTGEFVADLDTGELFRDGKILPLQDKPFRFLELLLSHPGSLVSYDEIERHLWPDVNVDTRHGIKEAALKIREALGDDAQRLQCLHGRGYRLMVWDLTVTEGSNAALREAVDLREVYVGRLSQTNRPCGPNRMALSPTNAESQSARDDLSGLVCSLA